MTEIINKIYYVGVNDRNKHRFEGLWPLPNGVSYNSYIIDDEKVALEYPRGDWRPRNRLSYHQPHGT